MKQSSVNDPGRCGVTLHAFGVFARQAPLALVPIMAAAVWLLDDGAFVIRRTGALAPSLPGRAA